MQASMRSPACAIQSRIARVPSVPPSSTYTISYGSSRSFKTADKRACVAGSTASSLNAGTTTLNNWGYRLEPQEGGTLVTEYYRLEPAWFTRAYWAVLGRLRGRTNRVGMRATLQAMKSVVEGGSGAQR